MNQAKLKSSLSAHALWLKTNGEKGKCVNFEGSDLREVELYKANLTRARLSRANLENAYLANANLEAADLQGANLQNANLEGANLSLANLESANLRNVCMESADLSDANLQNADLEEAELDEAVLVNANLQGANLEKTSLFSADLDLTNFIDANLKDALLNCVSCEGACFDGANLSGTNFTNATIEDTKLEGLTQENGGDSVIIKKVNLDSNIMEKAKSKFIEKVITAFDQEQIKDVVVEQYGITSINDINIKNGDILSNNNQIVYRLEFETTILLSCILDSEGNILDGISQISADSSTDVKENNLSESETKGDNSIIELNDISKSTE